MSRLVFLVGATGFLGKNLAEYLAVRNEYDVVAISKSGTPVFTLPGLTFVDFLKTNPPQDSIIINCAATRYNAADVSNPANRLLDNGNIVSDIYRFCLAKGITEVRQLSSLAVYPEGDPGNDGMAVDLNAPPRKGEEMYGWSKRISELYAQLFYEEYGINTITFRLSNPYGPYDSLDIDNAHVIPSLIMRALQSDDGLQAGGNLDATRDFTFVDDVCDVVRKSLWVTHKTATYNLCTGQQTPVREVALAILDILKKPKTVQSTNTLGNPALARPCKNDRLVKDFSIGAFTPLRKGLNKTIQWYQEVWA